MFAADQDHLSGAGSGHDLMKFLRRHPEAAGRLIFQDRDFVLRDVPPETRKGLVPMAHDFFHQQPVQGPCLEDHWSNNEALTLLGARAYFLHSILHNWYVLRCGH